MSELSQTIVALSSGAGVSGVAVLRVSGPRAGDLVEAIAGPLPAPRRASLRVFRDPAGAEEIDKGLVIWFPGPDSFSGEDMAEFHAHGGRAVVARLLDVMTARDGVRLAAAGEFSRRAFDNGKLDLTEVEGLADLIAAETEAQRRQALRQMSGAMGARSEAWRGRLLKALAYAEAELDFSDEDDVPESLGADIETAVTEVAADIEGCLDDGRGGERLRDGVKVAIAGPVNAGKSTLLNALARREAAIVSEQAGTTRDVIEVHMDLEGYPVTVVDTAGLRLAEDMVEQEGVRRAERAMAEADIVIWLEAADTAMGAAACGAVLAGKLVRRVVSKADLLREDDDLADIAKDWARLSVHGGKGLGELTTWLAKEAARLCGRAESGLISRARHRSALKDCAVALRRYLADPIAAGELRAEELRRAIHALGRITGRVDVEDVLDVIFRDFCVGK